MKNRYIDLMEKTLGAYSFAHIERYFDEVKTKGLSEHGFPRLTANIGILIAHGRKRELLSIFVEMMDFCCENIPRVKAANDFSVKEIIFCIMELGGKGIVSEEKIDEWKSDLKTIVPEKCYTQYAKTPSDKIFNWALFTAVSEYMRTYIGLASSEEFVDIQIPTQLRWLDENGMYRDDEENPPMVYDLVPRGLFAVLLHFGYNGKYRDEMDDCLKKAGLLTLKMQSVTGEAPFGGRSSQFMHNEAHLAIVLEYEAKRYAKEGNTALAREFRAAAKRALDNVEFWLSKEPIRHIKNRFPTETRYGCEGYAYFDKYMITTASFLYAAYLVCDDSIDENLPYDTRPYTAVTSDDFHKVFVGGYGYFLEFETSANMHYDASGLGRVQKMGAHPSVCMSAPCTKSPSYTVDIENAVDLSLAPGVLSGEKFIFATSPTSVYETLGRFADSERAEVEFKVTLEDKKSVFSKYELTENGVCVSVTGDGEVAHLLPAFYFDGEEYSEISFDKKCLEISYGLSKCRYTVDGEIVCTSERACSRHGHYKVFYAKGNKSLLVKIEII